MIDKCLKTSDLDKDIKNNIILSGGCTLLKGFKTRLEQEVNLVIKIDQI